jgi:hypothetical protein
MLERYLEVESTICRDGTMYAVSTVVRSHREVAARGSVNPLKAMQLNTSVTQV